MNVVDKHVFELEGSKAQPLLWKEHGFRIFIPEDALLPYETCHVSVKATVGGHFQFPEGTEPVSAIYGICFSRQPARMEMQHCVKLENPEHRKFMSFAIASHDPSSMSYTFHEVPGGGFEENKFFGSIDRQQFCFWTIIWRILGYGKLPLLILHTCEPKMYAGVIAYHHKSSCYVDCVLSIDTKCIYSASTFAQK